MNWLEPRWFFTEHYFYRRILEALGYFHAPTTGSPARTASRSDPFALQKRRGLDVAQAAIRDLVARLTSWTQHPDADRDTLFRLLHLDLWGNQADLSMWPAEGDSKPDHGDTARAGDFLLVDDTPQVADFLLSGHCPGEQRAEDGCCVDFLVDNAGFELVCDLALADYLLTTGLAETVRLHVKAHPTYVSDATAKDVAETLAYLQAMDAPEVQAWGRRLAGIREQDRLQVAENFFWNSPLPGWEMPLPLGETLSAAKLVISKGDAHYRRLLGDLDWPYTTPFSEIVAYFPAPLVALRTLKAELACGLAPGQAERIAAQDPDWLVDGRWGVVQFFCG
jgi:uncharacterized protein with ATP-grasp and redox domains